MDKTDAFDFDAHFVVNPNAAHGGLAFLPRGFIPGERSCPGCKHGECLHVAASCYACGNCGWSILGDGNAYGVPAGWWHYGVLKTLANREAYKQAKKVFDRHSKLGGLRRARRHPPTSRNKYYGRRAARDLARKVMGVWPR